MWSPKVMCSQHLGCPWLEENPWSLGDRFSVARRGLHLPGALTNFIFQARARADTEGSAQLGRSRGCPAGATPLGWRHRGVAAPRGRPARLASPRRPKGPAARRVRACSVSAGRAGGSRGAAVSSAGSSGGGPAGSGLRPCWGSGRGERAVPARAGEGLLPKPAGRPGPAGGLGRLKPHEVKLQSRP